MKESKLKYIVAIMTIAVIGLIGTQIYWISNIISIEREKFDRTVQGALLRVTAKLEKHETANTIIKKITPSKQNAIVFFENSAPGKIQPDGQNAKRLIRVELSGNDTGSFNYVLRSDSLQNHSVLIKKRSDTSNLIWKTRVDTFKVNREKLVQEVVTELVRVGEKSRKRFIDEKTINGYLAEEFSGAGIDTNFYFGVIDSGTDSMIVLKKGSDKQKIIQSDLRVLLFPDQLISGPDELAVYFPNRFGFILKTSSGMLILSIILIVVIIAVFQKTFRMLLSQRKLTQIKNDLINNITHEFKTPISSISLACEALNEPLLTGSAESVKRYSSIIKEENERLSMMVDTLLNSAALEKGKINFASEECDIHSLIHETVESFGDTVSSADGKFELQLNADSHSVAGDRFHLKNIFRNLVDNAVKYNNKSPVIIISTENSGNRIQISVNDNGIGIEKENIDKVFDTFFRVQSGNIQDIRGNGIGLSYAKQIVELLGGKISVASRPGEGSTFTITLPFSGGRNNE